MPRILFFICLTVLFSNRTFGQFGYGLTASNDLYQRYINPDDGKTKPSAGSALLNIGMGPKIWLGGKICRFRLRLRQY